MQTLIEFLHTVKLSLSEKKKKNRSNSPNKFKNSLITKPGISIPQAFSQSGGGTADFIGDDGLGCSHPHYGDGFAPHKQGQAAMVKT